MQRPEKRERAGAGHADPVEIEAPEKAISKYRESAEPATVTKFPLDWKTLRSRAAIRLAELIRLAQGRRGSGLLVDPHLFAWTMAATLGSVAAGPYKIPNRQRFLRWHGLDVESLRHVVARAELGEFQDAELATIIHSVEKWHVARGPGLQRSTFIGDHLQVTAAEREAFSLRTIEACDESREERQLRQAEARRVRDAERKRAERGRVPRPLYEANSVSSQRPWEAAGCSRSTFYRRHREGETGVSTHVLSLQGPRTDLSHGFGAAGPASGRISKRTDGAGGHSPGGRAIAEATDRTRIAAADDDAEGAASPSDQIFDNKKLAIMFPERSHPVIDYVKEPAALISTIEQAADILRTCHRRARGRSRDALGETLVLLSGLATIIRFESEDGAGRCAENVVAAAECGVTILQPYANDNTIGTIIPRLAA